MQSEISRDANTSSAINGKFILFFNRYYEYVHFNILLIDFYIQQIFILSASEYLVCAGSVIYKEECNSPPFKGSLCGKGGPTQSDGPQSHQQGCLHHYAMLQYWQGIKIYFVAVSRDKCFDKWSVLPDQQSYKPLETEKAMQNNILSPYYDCVPHVSVSVVWYWIFALFGSFSNCTLLTERRKEF